jgi:hypothetical protein
MFAVMAKHAKKLQILVMFFSDPGIRLVMDVTSFSTTHGTSASRLTPDSPPDLAPSFAFQIGFVIHDLYKCGIERFLPIMVFGCNLVQHYDVLGTHQGGGK